MSYETIEFIVGLMMITAMIIAVIQIIYRLINGIRRKIFMRRIKKAKRKSRWDNSPNTTWNQEQNRLFQEQFYRDQLRNLDEQSHFQQEQWYQQQQWHQQEHQRAHDNMVHDHQHHIDHYDHHMNNF